MKTGVWATQAEFIAAEFDISRQEMDEFACDSHNKAIAAQDSGKFLAEIVPVELAGRKGQATIFDSDETPRRDTSMEALAKLKPAFQKDGRVTAGNAPGLNDGAAAVVVASRAYADAQGLRPLARIVGYAQAAVEPKYLFDAPSKAMPRLLEKVGWSLQNVDLIELNEAFAAQALANAKALADLGWDWRKVNVNGGAIALGHPIGASGARSPDDLDFCPQRSRFETRRRFSVPGRGRSGCPGDRDRTSLSCLGKKELRMAIQHIYVVGAGTMGSGIAQTAAISGYQVTLMDVLPQQLERASETIKTSVGKLESKGLINPEQKAAALGLEMVSDHGRAGRADLIIEAATENPDLKLRIFGELDRLARPSVIVGLQHLFDQHHQNWGCYPTA